MILRKFNPNQVVWLQNQLPTSSITIKQTFFFIKTGLFLYIANFFLNNYSVLFNCSDVQKTPPKKLKNKKSLLAFFDHLDTPQSHTC
jgi:hypothetical protein